MIKNGIINLIGQVFKVGSSILVIPLLIKFLGLQTFGLLSWSTAILAAIQLAEGGLGAGLLYFLSEKNLSNQTIQEVKEQNKILTSGLILLVASTLTVTLALFFATPFLLNTLDNVPHAQKNEVKNALFLGSLLVGIKIIQSFFWAVLQSRYMYKAYSIISTVQIILANCGLALIAYLGEKDISKFILLNISISLVFTIYLCLSIIPLFPSFRWKLSKATTFKMLKYNMGVWGSNIGSILFSQGDKLVVANVLGIELLSVYTIFTNLVGQLNQFAAQAVHPIVPLVSSASKNASISSDSATISIKRIFLLNIYISLGGAGFFIILAEPILRFFLTDNFSIHYVLPFQILSLIYGIYTISVTGYYIMLGLGKSTKVMIVSIFCGVSTLLSMYLSRNLTEAVLSNAFFFFILILLFQGMKEINIRLKEWLAPVIIPIMVIILLTLFSSIVLLSFPHQILLTIIFSIFLLVSFVSKSDIIKKIPFFTALLKLIKNS